MNRPFSLIAATLFIAYGPVSLAIYPLLQTFIAIGLVYIAMLLFRWIDKKFDQLP